jgi:flagellar motor switch protein FliN/FliY
MKTENIGQMKVPMTVVLGTNMLPVADVAAVREGTIIQLDSLAGEPVSILAAGELIARGEVVIIDENFGVRVTELLDTQKVEASAGA